MSRTIIFCDQGPVASFDGERLVGTVALNCQQRGDATHGGGRWRGLLREETLKLALCQDGVRRRDLTARFGVSGETARRELWP